MKAIVYAFDRLAQKGLALEELEVDKAFVRQEELAQKFAARPEVDVQMVMGVSMSRFRELFPWRVPAAVSAP